MSTMIEHKFKIGQTVDFRSASRSRAAAVGRYRFVAQRPPDDGEPTYLIKSDLERHDRVARESEMTWIT
jgi:hypothetical protein